MSKTADKQCSIVFTVAARIKSLTLDYISSMQSSGIFSAARVIRIPTHVSRKFGTSLKNWQSIKPTSAKSASRMIMAAACSKFGFVDVMDLLHPKDAHIPSYARSKNRLDYALVSKDLVPEVTHLGLYHYHEFYPLDHRPIFLGLDPTLFGNLAAIVPNSTGVQYADLEEAQEEAIPCRSRRGIKRESIMTHS
jgi:hypothetical protein